MGRRTVNIKRLLLNKEGKPSWLYKRIFKLSHEEMELISFLGFVPNNFELYWQAFRHRSLQNKGVRVEHNERLEFLGDAVIDTIVSDNLFQIHPNAQEGALTEARAKIVHRVSLNKIAHEMGLDRLLRATKSARSNAPNLYGNALEALIGAVYLDQGYDRCKSYFHRNVIEKRTDIASLPTHKNAKSELLEWCQERHIANAYLLIETTQDARKQSHFTMQVQLGADLLMGTGKATSKKEAQQRAAQTTLRMIANDATIESHAIAATQRLASQRKEEAQCKEVEQPTDTERSTKAEQPATTATSEDSLQTS